jgi:hypothetical protein
MKMKSNLFLKQNLKLIISLFLFCLFQSPKAFAQIDEKRVDSIKKLKEYIDENKSNHELFEIVEIDGEIPQTITMKKVLGIFKKIVTIKYGGTFSETDIIKDTAIIYIMMWYRIYLNARRDSSKMSYREILYENVDLCYFYEIEKYERKSRPDSTLHEVEYYFTENNVIEKSVKGSIKDEEKFLSQILTESRNRYELKRDWIINWKDKY